MAFGKWEKAIVDDDGNIIPNVYVEVRREAPGFPLAIPIYEDFDGVTPKDNPFQAADGVPIFHVVGGFYRIRVYTGGGFDRTLRHEAIGTAQGADVDAYARAGFTWAPESSTSTPPTSGCIRFGNADVTLATHVYIHKTTLGGSNATAWLTGLELGDWLLLSTGVGTEVGWPVLSVTAVGNYFDILVDQANYSGPAGPLSLGDSGFITVSQQPGVLVGTELVITATGTTAVGATVGKVIVNLAAPGSVTLTLGAVAGRNSLPLVISDFGGNADITLTPYGSEKIMGLSSAELVSSGQGLGTGASTSLYPKTSLSGWFSA